MKRHVCFIPIWRQEEMPLICGSLHKVVEKGNFCPLPVCPLFANKPIPSLALDLISSGFHHILKTKWDMQLHGLSICCFLWLSIHSQTLLDLLDYSLFVVIIYPRSIYRDRLFYKFCYFTVSWHRQPFKAKYYAIMYARHLMCCESASSAKRNLLMRKERFTDL